jgi:hypothetical protein
MEKMEANVPVHFRFAASDLVLQLVIKLRRPNLDALLLLLLLLLLRAALLELQRSESATSLQNP